MSHKESVSQLVGQILNGDSETQYAGLKELSELFTYLTGLESFSNSRSSSKTGLILSSEDAASCMLSPNRTVKYWRACIEQIENKIQQCGECIHILYPGTGPFGTLLIPLLCHFQWQNLKITLIEFNQDSAQCLLRLIEILQVPHRISVHIQQAIEFVPEQPIDILLLECMLAGLQREGQVPITLHFSPCLKEDGVIIPQSVEVALEYINYQLDLSSIKKCNESGFLKESKKGFLRQRVSHLLSLDKQTEQAYIKTTSALLLGIINIPGPSKELPDLVVTTKIKLNNNHIIDEYEDGLTFPLCLSKHQLSNNTVTEVNYELFEQPGLSFSESK